MSKSFKDCNTEEEVREFVDNLYKNGKLPNRIFKEVDRDGHDEDYYIKCLSCGRCVYVGECCDNHVTQSMVDEGM